MTRVLPGGWDNPAVKLEKALKRIAVMHSNSLGICLICQRPHPCETWESANSALTNKRT